MLSDTENYIQIKVNFSDLLDYCGSRDKRIFIEGEKVLNANHIIHVGIDHKTNNKIFASVVNTSSLKGKPHHIEIYMHEDFQNWVKNCSCIAGQGSHCKHLFAVLLHIYRTEQLPVLTTTDYEQYWGINAAKHKYTELYTPKPIKQFCCARTKKIMEYSTNEEIAQANFGLISSVGALKIHHEQTRQTRKTIVRDTNNNKLLEYAAPSPLFCEQPYTEQICL